MACMQPDGTGATTHRHVVHESLDAASQWLGKRPVQVAQVELQAATLQPSARPGCGEGALPGMPSIRCPPAWTGRTGSGRLQLVSGHLLGAVWGQLAGQADPHQQLAVGHQPGPTGGQAQHLGKDGLHDHCMLSPHCHCAKDACKQRMPSESAVCSTSMTVTSRTPEAAGAPSCVASAKQVAG